MAEERSAAEIVAAERKALAEAMGAELDLVKKLVPDLSGVERGATSGQDKSTVLQALLGGRALQDAAGEVSRIVKIAVGDDYRVLLTTDLDLAARDADHLSLVEQLTQLRERIDQFLTRDPRSVTKVGGSIAAAAATLLPGLLSLVAANRTLTTSSATVDDDIAMMAVAGALAGADKEGTVVVEKARLLGPDGDALRSWTELRTACQTLATTLQGASGEDQKEWVAEGKELLKTCQAALDAVSTVAEGAKLSALAKASLQEALRSSQFHAVLIVKGSAASSTQLVEDRPLLFKDPLNVISTATISYLLIDPRKDSKVLAGGLAHGTAQITGTIGSKLSIGE